jgi:hypothetical protein
MFIPQWYFVMLYIYIIIIYIGFECVGPVLTMCYSRHESGCVLCLGRTSIGSAQAAQVMFPGTERSRPGVFLIILTCNVVPYS